MVSMNRQIAEVLIELNPYNNNDDRATDDLADNILQLLNLEGKMN